MSEPTKPCPYCLHAMELSDDETQWVCTCGHQENYQKKPDDAKEYRRKFGED